MGEREHLHCEHDIRNEHVCYSTNLSTKTPSVRISKNENRTNLFIIIIIIIIIYLFFIFYLFIYLFIYLFTYLFFFFLNIEKEICYRTNFNFWISKNEYRTNLSESRENVWH